MALKVSNETLVGVFATITIALLFLGFNFLKGDDLFVSSEKYYAIYEETSGLTTSSPIEVNGFKVGSVKSMSLLPDQRILVTFNISTNLELNNTTIARIISSDLLGSKAISLFNLGTMGKMLANKDTLIGENEESLSDRVSQEVLPVKLKAEALLGSLDSLTKSLQAVIGNEFGKSGVNNITHTIENFKQISDDIQKLVASESANISGTLKNINSITKNIESKKEDLGRTISNFAAISDSISKSDIGGTINNLSTSLAELNKSLGKLNSGEGSGGKMLSDPALYDNLNKSLSNLTKVLEDFYVNPKHYLSPLGKRNRKGTK